MARYGDLDELKLNVQRYMIPNDGCGMVSIEQAERWFLKLLDDLPRSDVVPKSEVELLEKELARAKEKYERSRFHLEAVLEEIAETRDKIAIEIFEEIETEIKHHGITYVQCKIAELKKKYTGEGAE